MLVPMLSSCTYEREGDTDFAFRLPATLGITSGSLSSLCLFWHFSPCIKDKYRKVQLCCYKLWKERSTLQMPPCSNLPVQLGYLSEGKGLLPTL